MIKSIALFALILLSAFNIKAQTDWKKVYSENGISVYLKTETCKNKMGHIVESSLVKIENNSGTSKTVEWDYEFVFSDKSLSKVKNENHRVVKVGSNETLEGACSTDVRNDLKVEMYFKDIKLAKEISEVKIINVKVKTL